MEELDYSYLKVQKIIDQEELVKERENLLEVASLDPISLLSHYLSKKEVKKILKV